MKGLKAKPGQARVADSHRREGLGGSLAWEGFRVSGQWSVVAGTPANSSGLIRNGLGMYSLVSIPSPWEETRER